MKPSLSKVWLLLLMGALCSPIAAYGAAGWIMTLCRPSHTLADDPIVYPGQPGASHLHQFFANQTTWASSTFDSMLAGPSTCPLDTAGYWVPVLYHNGVAVAPASDSRGVRVYYRKRVSRVAVPPPDLRVVARLKYGNEIYWGCSDNSTGKLLAPPSCPTGRITLHVGFPDCLLAGEVTHVDDTARMIRASSGKCPAGYVALPRIIVRLEYPVGPITGQVTLASGDVTTAHADFWNTWNQGVLATLVRDCLNAGRDCGKL